jgi:hypothetical protein
MELTALPATDTAVASRSRSSAFSGIRKGILNGKEPDPFLRDEFKKLITGDESISKSFVRLGDVKIGSRMTVNQTHVRTLASVSWQEGERIYASYFLLEDEFPLPHSIIDLSDSIK